MKFRSSLPFFPVLSLALLLAPLTPVGAATLNGSTTLKDEMVPSPTASDLTEPKFATAIDDLPLMPGLNLMQNNDFVFGSSNGRIAETDAIGIIDVDEVYKFYAQTLPHLGWKRLDARRYRRDNDMLRIDAHADGKDTTVHFSIRPAGSDK